MRGSTQQDFEYPQQQQQQRHDDNDNNDDNDNKFQAKIRNGDF
jgi:hypothetical protein